jgi:predicted N-acetyltransferase YhbS
MITPMSELIIKPTETEDEYRKAAELVARVYTDTDTEAYDRWYAGSLQAMSQPGFDMACHRLALLDGRIVAHVKAERRRLNYGSVQIPFGGIGIVCTDPAYQRRGIAAALMWDTIAYMKARGDVLSLLAGIPAYYPRFGYRNLWPNGWLNFKAAAAAALDAPLGMRAAEVADIPQLAALYEHCWGHRVTAPRSPDWWRWRIETYPPDYLRVFENRSGQIEGYAAGQGWETEIVAATSAATRSLAAHSGQMALEAGENTVTWLLPPDDRAIYDVRRWLNSEYRIEYNPTADWMGLILDGARLRDILMPEITLQTGLDERGLILDIQPEIVHIGLRGQDEDIELDHGTFLPVMFGALPPRMLDVSADAQRLLERLFPPRVAMLAPADWF